MTRIAFYAPIKPPDHPIPSGDREIARALVAALGEAGYAVELASRFIAYIKRSSSQTFAEKKIEGEAEAEALLKRWRGPGAMRPDLWFTYHPYCKAPDFLGPAVSAALGIPYATAEAARTGQGGETDWAEGRAVTQAAIRHADVNFCLKPSDEAYLLRVLGSSERIARLAPFIALPPPPARAAGADGPVRLVAVAMMRPGAKMQSYEMLAAGLARIGALDWTLTVVGDGPERARVEALFSGFAPGRVRFTGELGRDAVVAQLGESDIHVWPGMREAIGMAYLEAQAQALPVVAQNTLGVPWVVRDGETGLLTPEGDVDAFAAAIARLVGDPELRLRMGAAARRHVETRHSAAAAARTLKQHIDRVLAERGR